MFPKINFVIKERKMIDTESISQEVLIHTEAIPKAIPLFIHNNSEILQRKGGNMVGKNPATLAQCNFQTIFIFL